MSTPYTADPAPASPADLESSLLKLVEIVSNAKSVPLSSSAMISREEVLEILDEALSHLPTELREARWMLKNRDEFLAKTDRDAADILEAAKSRAAALVDKQEIVREANRRAQHIVDDASDLATRLRLEAEDYCDQKLANFEVVLDRLIKTARAGREKLSGQAALSGDSTLGGELTGVGSASTPAGLGLGAGEEFFDQDGTR
jgi:cell division septum initiation protein DivIVA